MAERREEGFVLYKSIFEAADALSPRSRGAFFAAVCDLYFRGIEPSGLSRDAQLLFTGVRPRIVRARSVAETKRASMDTDEDRTEAVPGAYDGRTEVVRSAYGTSIEAVPSDKNGIVPAETLPAPTDVVPRVGVGVGVGVPHDMNYGADGSALFNKRMDEAKRAVDEHGLDLLTDEHGDGLERLITTWIDDGWTDRDGKDLDEVVVNEGRTMPRWTSRLIGYHKAMERRAKEGYERPKYAPQPKRTRPKLALPDGAPDSGTVPCPKCGADATYWRTGSEVMVACASCGTFTSA